MVPDSSLRDVNSLGICGEHRGGRRGVDTVGEKRGLVFTAYGGLGARERSRRRLVPPAPLFQHCTTYVCMYDSIPYLHPS